jgi:hypothetical protein
MTILPHADSFDCMIDNMVDNYFILPLTSPTRLENIVPGSQLDLQQMIQLARFQLRDSEEREGVGLCSMASIIAPAFLAASFCHLHTTVPLLDQNNSILTQNSSFDLFTPPIFAAHEQIVSMGAKVITVDPRPSPDRIADTGLKLPDIRMFFDTNAAKTPSHLSKNYGARHLAEISCTLEATQQSASETCAG